ncbi:hypothetical protein IWW55_002135, partial [Coemansia sp. RSA 2706]
WGVIIVVLFYFTWKRRKQRREQERQRLEEADNEEGVINSKKARTLTKDEVDTLKLATLTEDDIQISKHMATARMSVSLSARDRLSVNSLAISPHRSSLPLPSNSSDVGLACPEPAAIAAKSNAPTRTKSTPLLVRLGHKLSSRHISSRKHSADQDGPIAQIHEENCAVCLDDFAVGDKVRQLPCQHYFHVSCIDPWLRKNSAVCPLCNFDVSGTFDVSEHASMHIQ